MNDLVYSSSLAKYIKGYLQEIKQLGYCTQNCRNQKYQLAVFDRFLCKRKFIGSRVDESTVEEWLKSLSHLKNATRYHYTVMTRAFLTYLNRYVTGCYLPAPPKRYSDFTPHIYSDKEIAAIFKAADNLRVQRRQPKMIFIVIPALLRLLYSTGMRINEVLAIRNGDVDFDRHIIVLNKTKNNRQRFAPLSDSMEDVLHQYMCYRNRLPIRSIAAPDSLLFVSGTGKACDQHVVGDIFKRILRDADIRHNSGVPRLHDLRYPNKNKIQTFEVIY